MSRYADPVFPAIFTAAQEYLRQFDRDLITALGNWSLNIKGILDKGISVDDNLDCDVIEFTSNAVAGTEDTIAHSLGKVPHHYIVTSVDKAAVIYRGTTAFTSTNVYLKSSVATTAVKIILL